MIEWLIGIIEAVVVIGGILLFADYIDSKSGKKTRESAIEKIIKKLRKKKRGR